MSALPPSTLAPSQLKASLWGDAQQRVFAIVIGARVADLAERLEQAGIVDHDCLWPGALSEEQRRAAPYLLALSRDSALSDWLLFEAGAGLGDWGLLLCSALPQLRLRSHCRALFGAQLSNGERIALDWVDPAVLRLLLPLASPEQLSLLFGATPRLLLPLAGGWASHTLQLGRLHSEGLSLL